jgi:hypothetical protein
MKKKGVSIFALWEKAAKAKAKEKKKVPTSTSNAYSVEIESNEAICS